MNVHDFNYILPQNLIAQSPVDPRDHSRMMVVSRKKNTIEHKHFYDLPEYIAPDDLIVFNDSRVIKARLHGRRRATGARVEILLLHRLSPGIWQSLVRPGRKMTVGTVVDVGNSEKNLAIEVIDVSEDGIRTVSLSNDDDVDKYGVVPLPPYIHEPLRDPERYQTVYSRVTGSIAAPTAGLHFTETLLSKLSAFGVEFAFVTLHVGWDSFKPVTAKFIGDHKMHSEYWTLSYESAKTINQAKKNGRRVISVGTTAVRLLESSAALPKNASSDTVTPGSGWTSLFMYPDYEFQVVDALITNFHLPKSTLLMLTSAFAGTDRILNAYRIAAKRGYRFYSLGDSMFIT